MELMAGIGAALVGTAAADAGAVAGTVGLLGAGGAIGGGTLGVGGTLGGLAAGVSVASGVKGLMASTKAPTFGSVPGAGDPAVQQAAAAAALAAGRSRGYGSTILSRDFIKSSSPALKETMGS